MKPSQCVTCQTIVPNHHLHNHHHRLLARKLQPKPKESTIWLANPTTMLSRTIAASNHCMLQGQLHAANLSAQHA